MKNIVKAGRGGAYRIPLDNAPPLRGWAIRYISGMEGEEEVEAGFYMAYWYPDSQGAVFAFERDLHSVFGDEAEAIHVRDSLKLSEIETEVERIN